MIIMGARVSSRLRIMRRISIELIEKTLAATLDRVLFVPSLNILFLF